jgi:ribosomal protein L21E
MTFPLQGGFVMKNVNKKILPVLVSALAIVALAMTPALAKDSKNKKSSRSSAKAAIEAAGHAPDQGDATQAVHQESKPGPAWKTIGGTVKKVQGDSYTVEDYDGNQVTLYVGQGTKHIHKKKVGDTVRAEITRGGFANSVQ